MSPPTITEVSSWGGGRCYIKKTKLTLFTAMAVVKQLHSEHNKPMAVLHLLHMYHAETPEFRTTLQLQ